jgi:predicted metal-dependent TIM-barrel fold hydrolase
MAAMLDAQFGNVENLKTNLAAAELLEVRQIAGRQKQLDQQAQEVGNAYGVIAALPDDKVQEFVDRLPEANKKALVSQIGEVNWSNMTGAEKKEAAKNLMLNAKGQMATQLKNIEIEKANVIILVYDVNNFEILKRLRTYWLPRIVKINDKIPIILCGNKMDLRSVIP